MDKAQNSNPHHTPTPPVSGPQCFKPVSECWCPLVGLPEILGGMQVNIHTYRRLLDT